LALVASGVGWPGLLVAQPARPMRIGLLAPRQQQLRANEVLARLQQLGWRQGDNLEVEQRIGETPDSLEQHAAELVRLRVDVIVTFLTPAALPPDAPLPACRS
jgi:hypothetical protein